MVNGNMISVVFEGAVAQNEVGYAELPADASGKPRRLMCEVVRIRGRNADMQVFEDTAGLKVGDTVEYTGDLLSAELGPGLLGQVFDGLQNPLPRLAEECGFFLQRGTYLNPVSREKEWRFTPLNLIFAPLIYIPSRGFTSTVLKPNFLLMVCTALLFW